MSNEPIQIDPDAPIVEAKEDRFAFSPFAEGLARVVAAYDRANSFTIGICGPWGSGKTSLINLTREALTTEMQEGDHNAYAVILPYSPWLIGNRDALLRGMLPAVADGIRQRVPRKKRSPDLKNAIRRLDQYGRAIKGVEAGLTVGVATAAAFGIAVSPLLAPIVTAVSGVGRIFGIFSAKPATLDEIRNAAQAALQKAKIRVLIVIDDLDRLDPSEVVEMSRLIRSTLDLPHVTFLVAYDRRQVAESVRSVLGVNGDAYLEKIVQLQVDIPTCSPYDLTRALAEQLQTVFGDLSEEQTESVRNALWGAARPLFLNTPRDVARTANSLSFGWSMLEGTVDAGDLLVATCLRIQAPDLYEWCRRYCEEYFVNQSNRAFGDGPDDRFMQDLTHACESAGIEQNTVVSILSDVLPGISNFSQPDEAASLFGSQDQEETDSAMRNGRLSSPQHWRKYFDLVEGRYGITDRGFATFLDDAVSSKKVAVQTLVEHARAVDPSGTNSGERLLDRMRAEARGSGLNPLQRISLVSVLSDAADELDRSFGPAPFFGTSAFQMAHWTLRDLMIPLSNYQRCDALRRAVENGVAIGWLSYVLRAELLEHGRLGQQDRTREPILSDDALDQVNAILLGRIQSIADSGALLELYSLPYPLLFWRDAGNDAQAVNEIVANAVVSDQDIVKFLLAMKQMVRSSAGDYWRIDRDLVGSFYNIDTAIARLHSIEEAESGRLSQKASEALEMLRRDRD